jgi:pimeloyl-ACP methyl ester carboxylesterase
MQQGDYHPVPAASQTSHNTDLRLKLPDGRFLGYAEYGDPGGRPLLFFHGTYGSRRLGQVLDTTAAEFGVRVIAPDRPGYGLSDYQPNRDFAAWAADVAALADALSIEQFAVLGVSGGGPHALACAYYIPERITAAGVASGIAPPDLPGAAIGTPRIQQLAMALNRRLPGLFGAYFSLLARLLGTSPARILAVTERSMASSDRALLHRYDVLGAAVLEDYIEAVRQEGRGQASDWAVIARPWGFNLGDIRVPVHIWQGEEDREVPLAAARAQAAAIPGSRLTVYPGEAHFAFFTHRAEILRELTAAP